MNVFTYYIVIKNSEYMPKCEKISKKNLQSSCDLADKHFEYSYFLGFFV